jgi:oligopeptide/dipeptide ABC transporter ATP-binding protein
VKTGGHLYPTPWIRAWERIDADFDGHLEEIRRFLRCPTVSASGDDMLAGAEHVAALIEGAGGKAEIVATAGHPAVLGHIGGDGPRLLRYGMYDVQPADEPGWSSPPFAAATTDVPGAGPSVVARGAANSKGALSAFLLAVASARRVSDLPVEIVLLVDGEEELGSPHLPGVMSARRDELAAEAAFDLDLTADRGGVAEVYLGCKGIVSFVLIARALSRAGLRPPERFFLNYPHELSGGQRQRVVIAAAIALEPRVLVADEPVSMLDASVRGEILKLLVRLKGAIGMTLVLITHDLAFAWALADRVAIMYLGKIVELGPTETVLTHPLHPYTRSLLSVTPEVGRRRVQQVLSGDPPDPAQIPPGCRFHPRCPVLRSGEAGPHEPHCRGEIPLLGELAPDHLAACHVAAAGDLPAANLKADA